MWYMGVSQNRDWSFTNSPMMESQMEKNMDDEMDSGVVYTGL